jgi:hypothetical protein
LGQMIGGKAVPGLFHLPIFQTSLFKCWDPDLAPDIAGIKTIPI